MSESGRPTPLPTAGVHRRRRIPLIWIVPLITALIAAWLAWDTFSKRGPTITISFKSAAGLTAGQSQLKFKDVTMGTVKSITVSPDLSKVLVTVETTHEAEPLLNDKTIFWVVKPQLFAGNISGLDTLLSGSYIGMLPSTEKGEAAALISSASRTRRSCEAGCPAPSSSCETQAAAARSASARRSSIAISRSARCSAGTSATWRATSPSTPSCARRSTSTCTTTRRSGTPPACR